MNRRIRFPLQVGIQSLYSLAFASATLVPGVITLLATLFILLVKGGLIIFLLFSQGWVVAGTIVMLEIMLLVRGVNHLRLALRTRPADAVLDDRGLQIVGGRLHGRSIVWSECKEVREEKVASDEVEDVERSRAVIEKLDGATVVIAEAADETELASLRALCESVHARLHPGELPPLPPEERPDLLRCPACSAPAAPLDADQTTCAYCSATVPIPAALRERLRASEEVLASSKVSASLLAKLLAQPSARHATLLSILAGIPIAATWILALSVGLVLYRHHGFRFANALLLSASAVVTIVGCYYLLRFWFVNRMALSVITLSFGAFPPAKEGTPWTCRSCSAPLPPARSGLLARCPWCNSDNVLGIDLRPRAAGARKERATLESAFARREADRRRYALRALVALALLPVSLWAFFRGSHALTREAKYVVACDGGDLTACVELGRFYLEVDTYDRDAAMHVFDDACKRGSLDACGELGDLLAAGDEQDLARGVALLSQACNVGHPSWCATLGQVVEARHPKGDDLPTAMALFHRACDGGSPRGCTLVAIELLRGVEVPKDAAAAARLLDESCRAHDAAACAYLAQLYFDGEGVPQDVPRAIAMFQDGCKGSRPVYRACAGLGRAYLDGRGVREDRVKAWDLLRRSCEYGHIGAACTRIAESQEGQGYLDRALDHYLMACAAGDAAGCVGVASVQVERATARDAIGTLRRSCLEQHMGMACALGGVWLANGKHGLAADTKQAADLYAAGCAIRHADSCNLGGQLADRQQDYAHARSLLARACELGEASGCNFLGKELEDGLGGPVDTAAALAAFQRACDLPPAGNKHSAQAYGCAHEGLLARKLGDEARALSRLRKACDWENEAACAALGAAN